MKRGARVVVVAAFVACGQPSTDPKPVAIDELSRAYSCPKERITATVRVDLPASSVELEADKPPADVAADPQRLAVWTAKQKDNEKQYQNEKVVEANGCGKHVFYTCGPAIGLHDTQVIACRLSSHPPLP